MTATLAMPATAPGSPGQVLSFAKYHGAGNDFVIVDGRSLRRRSDDTAWTALARQMCDRHFGIGADGLLVACDSEVGGALVRMRMYNPDGSESEMCGNARRARYRCPATLSLVSWPVIRCCTSRCGCPTHHSI